MGNVLFKTKDIKNNGKKRYCILIEKNVTECNFLKYADTDAEKGGLALD